MQLNFSERKSLDAASLHSTSEAIDFSKQGRSLDEIMPEASLNFPRRSMPSSVYLPPHVTLSAAIQGLGKGKSEINSDATLCNRCSLFHSMGDVSLAH